MSKKFLVAGIIILVVMAFLVWLFKASSQPLPGQKMTDMGRKHVPVGSLKDAPGDLATSGDHYADWIKAGVYETPKDDGYLIHSLEHGYVILLYNCEKRIQNSEFRIQNVYAHGVEESEASPSASEATSTGALSEAFKSEECHKLVDQLISVYEKKGKRKLIIAPRPQMDTKITLTSWNWLDKLDSFDMDRIEKFIDAHRDQGPERTAE